MENFIKNNPDQPEAIQAAAEWATEKAIQAQNEVAAALEMQDKAKKSAALASARKKFEEIRPQFVQARDSSAKIYAAIQARRPSARTLENAFLQLGDNKMNVAMIDFYLGLTLEDTAQATTPLSRAWRKSSTRSITITARKTSTTPSAGRRTSGMRAFSRSKASTRTPATSSKR